MGSVIKVISFFIALFVIINGIWVVLMPPFGDELTGYIIIAVGIFIPIITLYLEKRMKAGTIDISFAASIDPSGIM